MTSGVEFRILGSFEVYVDGVPVGLRGRLRVLAAVLVLSANQPVAVSSLASAIWQEDQPRRVRGSLQQLVTRLRRLIGPEVIETSEAGYRLRVDEEAVDLFRFRALARAADAAYAGGDRNAEVVALSAALRLWRADPLEDVPSEHLRRGTSAQLLEEWFRVLERRLDLDLAAGRERVLLSELRSLTARYPTREALWQRLVLALYRADRRAEALESYQAVASALRAGLGLDPSEELRKLHQAVLTADRSLDLPPSQGERAESSRTTGAATIGSAAAQTAPAQTASAERSPASGPSRISQPEAEELVFREVVKPRELPAVPPYFTGRTAELAALDQLIAAAENDRDTGPGPGVAMIVGPAGVGKTTLALRWAHQLADRFPDGQFFLNLRGFGPGPARDRMEAAAALLRAAGVRPGAIPLDLEGRSALLRSTLAGRRAIIVLDNAADSDQVRPLLPGEGCLVVVTSRRQLRALVTHTGGRRLTLEPLNRTEAARLVGAVIALAGGTVEKAAVDDLVSVSGQLPLALMIAAERLARLPGVSLSEVTSELRNMVRQLDEFSAGEGADTDLRAVFSWSYDELDPAAARMFRLLGAHPGDDIGLGAAAALAGISDREAAMLLDRLVSIHLIGRRADGRYEFHDLLRAYAAELASEGAERRSALRRLSDWYLHSMRNARLLLTTDADRAALAEPDLLVRPLEFTDRAQVVAWALAELPSYAQVARSVADRGLDRDTVRFALVGWTPFYVTESWHDMYVVCESGVRAARRLVDAKGGEAAPEDRLLLARCANNLNTPCRRLGRFGAAVRCGELAIELFSELGDIRALTIALLNLGTTYNREMLFGPAEPLLQRALTLSRTERNAHLEAAAHENLADSHTGLGDLDSAIGHAELAVDAFRDIGEYFRRTSALRVLGEAYAAAGRPERAIGSYREALKTAESDQRPEFAAEIRVSLGHQFAATGDFEAARDTWRRAYDIYRERSDSRATEVSALLADLD